ncbi:MAG: universal stress protein [Clostridia bacterium]|nr:universal stress protein [Clostridia bacterium]
MKKILVPIDGSEYSDKALVKAKELAGAFDSQVVLLNVMNDASTISSLHYASINNIINLPDLKEEAKKKSNSVLEEAKKTFSDISVPVETVSLDEPTGNIARAIADYANDYNPDVIVMGSNGIGSLKQRLYLGSVTTRVLHIVHKPVLVVQ